MDEGREICVGTVFPPQRSGSRILVIWPYSEACSAHLTHPVKLQRAAREPASGVDVGGAGRRGCLILAGGSEPVHYSGFSASIAFPSKSIQANGGHLVGLLTRASSNLNCLPRTSAPVASLAPALRAHSGGTVPVSHQLPVCTKLAAIKSPGSTRCHVGILEDSAFRR